MPDLTKKCQFIAMFGSLPEHHPSKFLIALTVLHYPYSATVWEFYEDTPNEYLGTVEFDTHKVHIMWDTRTGKQPTSKQREQMKSVINDVSTNKRSGTHAMIDYQIKAHKRAQAMEAQRNTPQEGE